jgi:DNA-directed RNA polymerase specialized sigma24 family protein
MFSQMVHTEPLVSFCLCRDKFDFLVHRWSRLVRYRLRATGNAFGVDIDQLENDVYVSMYQFLLRDHLREWQIRDLDRVCMTVTKRVMLNDVRHRTTKKRAGLLERSVPCSECEYRVRNAWDDVELGDLLQVAAERSSTSPQIVELWMVGTSYAEIASRLKMTKYAVSRDLESILTQIRRLLECE